VRKTVRAAIDMRIRQLTLYSFSSENWSRPPEEIDFLFGLFRLYIRRDVTQLHDLGVRINVIGSRAGVPADILALIEEAETRTAANRTLHLVFAFNYGARDEIARATRAIAEEVKAGTLDPARITETTISDHLDTAALPDPDLVIRTGREVRLSNFLLWQSAYAEFVFLTQNWPDFGAETLAAAIDEFATRTRRFGGRGTRETT
jgi:undecaprenyl diphosphate synthase